jgi:hypothetical protein
LAGESACPTFLQALNSKDLFFTPVRDAVFQEPERLLNITASGLFHGARQILWSTPFHFADDFRSALAQCTIRTPALGQGRRGYSRVVRQAVRHLDQG